jgi:glyoxylase-like metal-dependent hydrolase (beta-lactamase superfamily II)
MKLANNLYFYPEQGELDCNTYIFTGKPGIIIDPGNPHFLAARVESMREDGIEPREIGIIVNTHLHIDHCRGNEPFKKLSGAKIALHPVQQQNYRSVVIDGARYLGMTPAEFKWDSSLEDSRLSVGDMELELIFAPGHSPECICFYHRPDKVLVCGDVLFEMNTGRVDLPGGDRDALKKSIEALSRLDIEYLLPGHMGVVAGAAKVAANFDFIRSNVFPWL